MHKTHWLTAALWGSTLRPACGQRDVPATEDPADVTCLNCQKAIEDDMKTDRDRAEEEGERKARQRARSKAVSELISRHEEEFYALWDVWAVELHDECVKEALETIQQRREWDRDWRERKKAELREQLVALGADDA